MIKLNKDKFMETKTNQRAAYALAAISFLILCSSFLPYTNIGGDNYSIVELTFAMREYAPSVVLNFLGFVFAGYIMLHIANIFVLAHGYSRKITIISSIYFLALTVISTIIFTFKYGDLYAYSYGSIIGENLVWMLQVLLFVMSYYMCPANVDANSFAVKNVPVEPTNAPTLRLMNVWNGRGLEVELKWNGRVVGTYKIEKNRLSEEITVPALNVTVNVKGHFEIPLELGERAKYVLEIHRTQLKQYNNTGFLLREYGCSTGMSCLCFLIPILGLIIGAINWKKSPLYAKGAMRYALWGSIFSVMYSALSSLQYLI